MPITTRCTCGQSIDGRCHSDIEGCKQLFHHKMDNHYNDQIESMEEKKCNCNEIYDSDKFQGGYPYCPVHDKRPAINHDRVIANQVAGMPLEEAIFQTGYSSGHDAGYEKGKRAVQLGGIWVNCKNGLPEDWQIMHMRYAADHYKLDTDLFEERDGALCKKGGTGRLEFHEAEYLDESADKPQPGAVWVKASERLPGYETPVKWRDGKDHSHVTDGKIPLINMAKPFLAGWEWYDESVTAQHNWISAEKKPEQNVGVLVFIPGEDNHITSGMWDVSNKWVLLDEYRTPEEEVTHWKPLPAFPQGYSWNEIPGDLVDALNKVAKEELSKRELPATGREEDAVAFNIFCTDGYYYDHGYWWHKSSHEKYSVDQLYELFKQQKEK